MISYIHVELGSLAFPYESMPRKTPTTLAARLVISTSENARRKQQNSARIGRMGPSRVLVRPNK